MGNSAPLLLLVLLFQMNILTPADGCLGLFTGDPHYVVGLAAPCRPGPRRLPGGHHCECECPRPKRCLLRCRDHLGDEATGSVGRPKKPLGLLDVYNKPPPSDPYEKDP